MKRSFTVRPDRDLSKCIVYSYEKFRQLELVAERTIPSLNQYICDLILGGLQSQVAETGYDN